MTIKQTIWLLAAAAAAGAAAAPRTNALDCLPAGDFVARLYYTDQLELTNLYRYDIHYVNRTERYARVGVNSNLYVQFIREGWTVLVDEEATADLYPEVSPFTFNGGYREVHENYAAMRAVTAAYPMITEIIDYGDSQNKMMGGDTHGGQFNPGFDLLAMKITNKQIPGPKPVFFLMCAIHAREITTPEMGMLLIDWLTQRYVSDPDVRWMVDYHVTYVVPNVNPDGYWIAAMGPYMQRKNANRAGSTYWPPSSSTQYGVDLNRNHSFKWNSGGSSGNPLDQTYRGTFAASEPEVYALQTFIESLIPDQRGPGDYDAAPTNTTGILITLHSYGDLVLWPWGFTSSAAPNGAALSAIGNKFATYNGYSPGQSYSLYPTSGTSDEWGYGVLGIPAFTFECGSTFMPSYSDVARQWNLNRPAFLYACKLAHTPYMTVYGPDALNVTATPSGNNVILTATIDDTKNGNQPVTAAEYYIDVPHWRSGAVAVPMSAADGSFNSPIEVVTATISAGAFAERQRVLLVRGRDSGGNWGPYSAAFAHLQDVPPPFVDITTPNHTVPYETMTVTIEGTNSPAVVGGMTWTNMANGAAGTGAAATSWQITGVPLVVGANQIIVIGTNMAGTAAQDVVTVTRAGALPPYVAITNDDYSVSYDHTGATIGGVINNSTIGWLSWHNELNGARGAVAAVSSWTITNIPLGVGTNVITVTGTNAMNASSSDTVTITRGGLGTGAPYTRIVSGWCSPTMMTVNGTNNAHVVGAVRWINLRNGASGSIAAAPAWTIRTRYFEPGDNLIWVCGTNALGEASSHEMVISATGPPFVDITNVNMTVDYDIEQTAVGGTNNAFVTGMMTWTNLLTTGHGVITAAPAWAVQSIWLAEGTNKIIVRGANSAGVAAYDTVTVVRSTAPFGIPVVTIFQDDCTVPYTVTSIHLSGTCNEHVVGMMEYESFIGPDTVDWGTFPAAPLWSIDVQLEVGENEIYVWGTNVIGEDSWDVVLVTRLPEEERADPLAHFSIRLSNDFATPLLLWSNTTATVLACTNDQYTLAPGAWFVRAERVQPPWLDVAAPQTKAVFYRLVAGTATSAYDVGKMTLVVRQSDGVAKAETWLSSPFDFMTAEGEVTAAVPFDEVGLAQVVNDERGMASRRDKIVSQSTFGGTVVSASRGNGVWLAAQPAATNWYRARMYKVIINEAHTGSMRRVTLVGRVSTNDPAHVADVRQSDGISKVENWCAAWFPWQLPFDQCGIADVVSNEAARPTRRDQVVSQHAFQIVSAIRGNGVWLPSAPAATNVYPGSGYNVIINKAHPGTARAWRVRRVIP